MALYDSIRRDKGVYSNTYDDEQTTAVTSTPALNSRPRVRILPFTYPITTPATARLAKIATTTLSNELRRLRDLEVDDANILWRNDEHFLVEGRIEVTQSSLRLEVRLVNAIAHAEIWRHEIVGTGDARVDFVPTTMEKVAVALANQISRVAGNVAHDPLDGFRPFTMNFEFSARERNDAEYLHVPTDWTLRAYASDDAIRYYRRALAAAKTNDTSSSERHTLIERLADLLVNSGQRIEALHHYQTLSETAASMNDTRWQARLCRKIARTHWEGGARTDAKELLRQAFKLLRDGESSLERAHVCLEMGSLAFRSGENATAAKWSKRALDEALPFFENGMLLDRMNTPQRITGAATILSEANNTLGITYARIGRLDEAMVYVERSLEIAESHDLSHAKCRACANLGILYASRDAARAIKISQKGLEVAKRTGDLAIQSRLYTNLGVALCTFHVRRDKDGLAAVKRSIELDRRLNLVDHLPMPLIALGQIHQCHGQHRKAIEYYQEALPIAETLGEPQILYPCYDGLATAMLEVDDLAGAREYLGKAQAVCRRAGLDPKSFLSLPFLC
jgi:adenylate cyclase